MPSLIAHIFIGLLAAGALRLKRKSLLLLGCILPDAKIFLYAAMAPFFELWETNAAIIAIHSPFGAVLLAGFVASLLPRGKALSGFGLLALGVGLHFLLDFAIYPFYGIEHYLPLFPFSWAVWGVDAGEYIRFFGIAGLATGAFIVARDAILKSKR